MKRSRPTVVSFHFPYFHSLAEALVKAEGRGAIAAFSPSGPSLNGPARLFHEALLKELLFRNHPRLGDALLAAQAAYADTGALAELLQITCSGTHPPPPLDPASRRPERIAECEDDPSPCSWTMSRRTRDGSRRAPIPKGIDGLRYLPSPEHACRFGGKTWGSPDHGIRDFHPSPQGR